MPRARSTPFPAQLARYLRDLNGVPTTFSARKLAEEFEIPRGHKPTTTVGQIHRALQLAFSRGEIITFVDEHGGRLREDQFTVHGSAAVEHPCIFATPGTPSPAAGYEPVTFEQLSAMPSPDGRDTDSSDALADLNAGDEDADAEAHTDADRREKEERGRALVARIEAWKATEPAPAWLPDELLRIWVALPSAQDRWRAGLDQAPKPERLQLIRAGVKRKGGFSADSITALQLARLCREKAGIWGQCARAVIAQEDLLGFDELSAFVDDPLTFTDTHEASAAVLALTGAILGLDPDAMELIAAGAVEGIAEAEADAMEARLRHRAEALQAELDEVRDELRMQEEATRRAKAEADKLGSELDRLREEAERAGSIDEQLARERAARHTELSRIAELEARLESADADRARVRELAERLQLAEQAQDEAAARNEQLARERELRTEIEVQVQDALRRNRELTAQLRDAAQTGVQLPVEDADALLRALGRPIGQAAGHAAGRMASGQAGDGDQRLLQLAAAYGQLAIPATPAELPKPTAISPADIAAVTTVTAEAANTPGGDPGAGVVASTESDTLVSATSDGKRPEPTADMDPAAGHGGSAPERNPVRRRPRPQQSPFSVRPIGGAEEIGGSAILVQIRDSSVLLDAGQRVKNEYGGGDVAEFHFGVPGVDHQNGIQISHAHIDHVGSLPLVQQAHSEQQKSTVPVWMSAPTLDLARIMLEDSAKIQHFREQNAEALAESDFAPDSMRRAYTRKDVEEVLSEEVVRIAAPREPQPIPGTDLVAKFLPVAHVLGSCAVHLKDTATGATLLYTGDLGPFGDPQVTLPDFGGASGLEGADIVIMESTYGLLSDEDREGRVRLTGRDRAIQLLADAAHKAIDRGGFVLLPSFSLGRTQEIATIIGNERGRRLPQGPIYLGGMGSKIINVYEHYGATRRGNWARPGGIPSTSSINSWLPEDGNFDEAVHDILNDEKPGYIIASPAMVSGGWSRAFLREMAGDDRHAVVFTGYLPRHAGGIPNLGHLRKGAQLRIPGEQPITIRSEWKRAQGLSAHAPGRDLRKFAEEISRGRNHVSFGIVHGEPECQRALAADINEMVDNATATSLQRNVRWPRRG